MTKEEAELIIKEQDKNTKEILKVIEKEKCELLGIIQGKDKVIKDLKLQLQEVIYQAKNKRLEEENAKLKAQIEQMKICQNCKFEPNDYMEKPCCDCTRCLGDIKRKGNSDKWEMK